MGPFTYCRQKLLNWIFSSPSLFQFYIRHVMIYKLHTLNFHILKSFWLRIKQICKIYDWSIKRPFVLSYTLNRFKTVLTLWSAGRAKSYNTRITHTISKHIRLVMTEALLKSLAGVFIFHSSHEVVQNIWFNRLEFDYFDNVSLPAYHLENKMFFLNFFARFQSVLKNKNSQAHWDC